MRRRRGRKHSDKTMETAHRGVAEDAVRAPFDFSAHVCVLQNQERHGSFWIVWIWSEAFRVGVVVIDS